MRFVITSSLVVVVLLVHSAVFTMAQAQDEGSNITTGPCDLECYHNTTCVPGNADFSNHPISDGQPLDMHIKTISPNGWRCDCPDGKTGLRCGRTYIGCQNKDHKCYNGGKCIPGVADRFGNDQDFCDCTDAVDKHGVKHVGKYCEVPVPVTCGDDNDDVFCVNGGYCKDKWKEETHRPCRCGPKHDGQHCEYVKGEIPDCTLDCKHGGKCKLGIKNYKTAEFEYQIWWSNKTTDFMHCACPDGYFGLHCEVSAKQCGDHHCFNGGTCVTIGSELDGGIVDHHCDCTTAKTNSKSFAGRFCQYESSNFCDKTLGSNGLKFCVNGGTCKAVGDVIGCDCPDGYHGPVCEFHESEQNGDYETCSLQCKNGGRCHKGVKDVSFLDKFHLGPVASSLNKTHNQDFEHCVCPDGYVGHTCDIKVETCGENAHICLYGSKCVPDGDGHKCDCEQAFSLPGMAKYAGASCQHKATEFCTGNGDFGAGDDNLSFCVNNGTCVAKKDGGHPGCNCPDGFSGVHCEVFGIAEDSTTSGGSGNSRNVPAIVLSVLLVGAIACGVAFVYRWRWSKFGRDTNFVENNKATDPNGATSSPGVVDVGPEKDLDGNELENVEII